MKNKKLIMVVEDNVDLADHISSTLTKTQQYDIINAYDGLQAFELYNANKRFLGVGENRIKCIILDLKMGKIDEQKDGITFLKKLREQEIVKKIPVIILSAYEDREKWLAVTDKKYGAVCRYLKKPFQKLELLNTINRVFSGNTDDMIQETLNECYERIEQFIDTRVKKDIKANVVEETERIQILDPSIELMRVDATKNQKTSNEVDIVHQKVLIGTIYHHQGTINSVHHCGVNKVILMHQEEPDDTVTNSINFLNNHIGKFLSVEKKTFDSSSIVKIAEQAVKIIDSIPKETEIFIDISSGLKFHSMGLLFGAYARFNRIKKIVYVSEQPKKIVSIPKVEYSINDGQRNILNMIITKPGITTLDIVNNQELSQGIIYKYVKQLLDNNAIDKKGDKLYITDFGSILAL